MLNRKKINHHYRSGYIKFFVKNLFFSLRIKMCQALSQRDPHAAESLNSDRIKSSTYCQLDFYLSTVSDTGLLFVFPKRVGVECFFAHVRKWRSHRYTTCRANNVGTGVVYFLTYTKIRHNWTSFPDSIVAVHRFCNSSFSCAVVFILKFFRSSRTICKIYAFLTLYKPSK